MSSGLSVLKVDRVGTVQVLTIGQSESISCPNWPSVVRRVEHERVTVLTYKKLVREKAGRSANTYLSRTDEGFAEDSSSGGHIGSQIPACCL